jgi:prolyl oligopeptidase PreP (S9A serine peptidase family)
MHARAGGLSVHLCPPPQDDALLVCYLRDVVSALELRSLASGAVTKRLGMPGLGSVSAVSGRREDAEFFFSFTGFTEPGAIYRRAPAPRQRVQRGPVLKFLRFQVDGFGIFFLRLC